MSLRAGILTLPGTAVGPTSPLPLVDPLAMIGTIADNVR